MKRFLLMIVLVTGLSQAYAQPGYEEMNPAEFLNSDLPDAEFDLFNPDYKLLYATVFHTVNYRRVKKGYPLLAYSDELHKAADSLTRDNRTARFVFNEQNVTRMTKYVKPEVKQCGFKGNLVGFAISAPYALNYKPGKEFYYNRKDSETTYKLYYGNIKDRNNPKVTKKPVSPYTYRQFAEALVKQWMRGSNGKAIMNKGYSHFACAIQVDPNTLLRYKIPVAKSLALLGGRVINFDQ